MMMESPIRNIVFDGIKIPYEIFQHCKYVFLLVGHKVHFLPHNRKTIVCNAGRTFISTHTKLTFFSLVAQYTIM